MDLSLSKKAEKEMMKNNWAITREEVDIMVNSESRYYPVRLLLSSGKKVNCYYDSLNKTYVKFSIFNILNVKRYRHIGLRLRKVKKIKYDIKKCKGV